MPQKIKIIRTEKTEEYLERERTALASIRNKMIQDTNWTQLIDSNLRLYSVVEFCYWRHKLRNLSLIDKDNFTQEIDKLKLNKPNADYCLADDTAIVLPIQLNFSSVASVQRTVALNVSWLNNLSNGLSQQMYTHGELSGILKAESVDDAVKNFVEYLKYGYRH